jgi:hypothetical protein
MTILSLYILFGRGRYWSHPSSDWFFFLVSDWLIDTGFCHLIGQISWLVIVWWSDLIVNSLSWRLCIDGVHWSLGVVIGLLLCHWFVSLHSDWIIGWKWWLLIGQISWLLICLWWNTSQSFYHPIIGCPDVTVSILVFSTIGLCEHIQYIQSICIHYAVFKHSWYDSVVYCYTIHLEMNSSHINIYIYSKAIFLDTWEFWRTSTSSNKVFNNQNWKSECSDLYFFPGIIGEDFYL